MTLYVNKLYNLEHKACMLFNNIFEFQVTLNYAQNVTNSVAILKVNG